MARYAAFLGDSHTFNTGNGLIAADFHPYQVQKLVGAADLRCRNHGNSGDTSAQLVARMTAATDLAVPVFASIYIGTNDTLAANQSTVQASPSPTSTVFAVASGKAATIAKPGSWVLVNGVSRQVESVSSDTITLATALSGAPTAGQAVTVDTQSNIVEIGNYLKALGCANIIVGLQHFLNWSSGGDTVSTPLASNAALRVLQTAAATTLGAQTADHYTAMRSRIATGPDAAGYASTTVASSIGPNLFTVASATGLSAGQTIVADGLKGTIIGVSGKLIRTTGMRSAPAATSVVSANWHVADSDSHLNPYGQGILASTVASIVTTNRWA